MINIDTQNAVLIDPEKARSCHVSLIGMTGSGKTNGIFVWVEQEMQLGGLVTLIDSEGDFRPLKACGFLVIGKGRKNKPVDIPVAPEQAAQMAQIVIEHRISVIVDLSGYPLPERDAFVAAYLGRLWELYQDEDLPPMRVVIDEIQLFAPQSERTASKALLKDIAGRGRKNFFVLAVATQRPQNVDKTILDACAIRIFLKVGLGRTLDAIRDLLPGHMQKRAEDILPAFKQGEAVIEMDAESSIIQIRQSDIFEQKDALVPLAAASSIDESTIKALAAALTANNPPADDDPLIRHDESNLMKMLRTDMKQQHDRADLLEEENKRLRNIIAQLEADNRELLNERGELFKQIEQLKADAKLPLPHAGAGANGSGKEEAASDQPYLSERAVQRRVNSQQRLWDQLVGRLRGMGPATQRILKELLIQDRQLSAREVAVLAGLSEATIRTSRNYMPLVNLGLLVHVGGGELAPTVRAYLQKHCPDIDHDDQIEQLIKAL